MGVLMGLIGAQAHAAATAPGQIRSFHIDAVQPAFGGKVPPGAKGAYEVIRATVTGTLDPSAAANAGIVDLRHAPRDSQGQVRYRSNVVVLRPVHAADASRVLIYDVANRGGLLGKGTFVGGGALVGGDPPDARFPSWLAHGYTVVWSGWQGDIPLASKGLRLGTDFPLAQINGRAETGLSREEYIPDNAGGPADTFRLSYAPANKVDHAHVQFTARDTWRDAKGRQTYAAPSAAVTQWHYTTLDGQPAVTFTPPAKVPGVHGQPVKPDAGTIYSFVYKARGSRVDGIGFAAVRDLVQFLRHGARDGEGQANPLADLRRAHCVVATCPAHASDTVDIALGVGISQSGRFLRDFLYQGFNNTGDGQRVFDGLMPIIAGARRTWVNTRFAQPGRWSKQHEDHFMRGFQFPFAYNVITDPVSGRRDGLLKACRASQTCPKIMQVDGSFEWWNGAGSLVTTDGAGHDLSLPANVRYYMVPGTGHGGGPGVQGGLVAGSHPPACLYPDSPISEEPFDRALFARLVDWVKDGRVPPASQYPEASDGTAVAPDAVGFPSLSDAQVAGPKGAAVPLSVAFTGVHNQVFVTHYQHAVPQVSLHQRYRVLEPAVNATGNERAGIATPGVTVPLASYTGWNLRAPGHAAGELCGMHGATLPLARDAAMHSASDPRPALSQLYATRADYQRKVDSAVDALVKGGYLLPADARAIYRARARQVSKKLLP
ncbi:peptidase [Oleiagrimonas sp. C23AA]|nr:peptidase [Oleiagrimonas sp. C23AA]